MKAFFEEKNHDSNFPVCVYRRDNFNFRAHWHMEVELAYVCEGQIRIGVNNGTYILNKGDLAIFGSSDIHFYDCRGLQSRIIFLLFDPGLIGNITLWPRELYFSPPVVSSGYFDMLGEEMGQKIRDIFTAIHEEYDTKEPYYEMFIRSNILEFCATALRHFPKQEYNVNDISKRPPQLKIMQTVFEYLETNYSSPITLEGLANIANISPFYFSRLFKKFSGKNFKEYINCIRVDKAEDLIRNSDKPITDIAFECGFNSIRTFNRAYKSAKGQAPRNYR